MHKNIDMSFAKFMNFWVRLTSLQNGWIWKHAAVDFMVFAVFLNSNEMQYQMKDRSFWYINLKNVSLWRGMLIMEESVSVSVCLCGGGLIENLYTFHSILLWMWKWYKTFSLLRKKRKIHTIIPISAQKSLKKKNSTNFHDNCC